MEATHKHHARSALMGRDVSLGLVDIAHYRHTGIGRFLGQFLDLSIADDEGHVGICDD